MALARFSSDRLLTVFGGVLQIYALDKNPIAIAAMFAKVDDEWALHANSIQIVESDMRSFDPEEKADILISELLGSFGCNELSPECLDGAQRFLKASGISIPCSYKNFLQPIMAVTTYEDLETYAPKAENLLNEMVLVELRSCVAIAPYQEVFTFTHPNFGGLMELGFLRLDNQWMDFLSNEAGGIIENKRPLNQ